MSELAKINSKQRKAIESLCAGHDLETTATIAGVHPTTVSRWRNHDEGFIAALREAQANLVDDHSAGLVTMLGGNRDVLLEIRDDVNQPGHIRLRAVEIIENSLLRWREHKEMFERMAEIEAMIHEIQRN